VAVDMVKLAAVYRKIGNYDQAQQYFQQAQSILKTKLPDHHYRRAELCFQYAKLNDDMDKPEMAQ